VAGTEAQVEGLASEAHRAAGIGEWETRHWRVTPSPSNFNLELTSEHLSRTSRSRLPTSPHRSLVDIASPACEGALGRPDSAASADPKGE